MAADKSRPRRALSPREPNSACNKSVDEARGGIVDIGFRRRRRADGTRRHQIQTAISVVRRVDGRYVGFVPGRRWVRSEPALYAELKEQSQVKLDLVCRKQQSQTAAQRAGRLFLSL